MPEVVRRNRGMIRAYRDVGCVPEWLSHGRGRQLFSSGQPMVMVDQRFGEAPDTMTFVLLRTGARRGT